MRRGEQVRHFASTPGSDYRPLNVIFGTPEGDYYSPHAVGMRIVSMMKKAGLQGVTLHSFRHSHASELHAFGADEVAAAENMGRRNGGHHSRKPNHCFSTPHVHKCERETY